MNQESYGKYVFIEMLAIGFGTGYRLWNVLPHNLLALIAAVAAAYAYLFLGSRKQLVYWMIIPRMAIWAFITLETVRIVAMVHDAPLDSIWMSFFICFAEFLVVWLSISAKRQFSREEAVSQSAATGA